MKAYIEEIQPTMRETVAWLTALGFHTTDSGDGEINVAAGMEGALDFPHVMMTTTRAALLDDADRLWVECCTACLASHDGVRVSASYDPADGVGVLMLEGVTDALLAVRS